MDKIADSIKDIIAFSTPIIERGKRVKIIQYNPTRSTLQNAALHLYFTFISKQLIELGWTHTFKGLSGKKIQLVYTDVLVKEIVWRPIQIAMFNIQSTKDIDTSHINLIIDVITKLFADLGVVLKKFPSKFEKWIEQLNKENYI